MLGGVKERRTIAVSCGRCRETGILGEKQVDRKKVLQWVTFSLNLIVYFGILNLIFFGGFRLITQGYPNPWIAWGVIIVQEGVLLYFLGCHLYREIMLTSPERRGERAGEISRTVTALRYAGLTILGGMLFLVFLKIVGCFDIIYAGWPLLLFPVGVTAAVLFGIFRPKKRGADWKVSLLCWSLLLGLPFSLVLLGSLTMIPERFEYRTSELRPWRYFSISSKMIRQSFPPEAKNCIIRGNNGFGFGYFWSCECPEEAFLRFASKNGYVLQTEDSTDAEGRRLKDFLSFDMFREIGLERTPASFYYYNNRWPNGGGWTLVYDRSRHILYGNYVAR